VTLSELLPFVVSGIAVGTVYGLAATSLVLTYKTSGIFNFGYGALAAVAAYLFYWLHVEHSVSWPVAMLVSVLVAGPLMGVLMERLAALLALRDTALQIVGTIGLILVVRSLGTIAFGPTTLQMPPFLPRATDSFVVADVVITYDKVVLAVLAVLGATGLYALLRFTRAGLTMRAVVDSPDLLALHGKDPNRVRRVAWVLGSTFVALSGVLITPLVGVDAVLLTYLVVQAAAAAAIGGFASIPLTFAGGIAIGVAAAVAQKYALNEDWLSGLPASLPFIVLFVVLLLRGRRLVAASAPRVRPMVRYRASGSIRAMLGVAVLVPLLLVPLLVGDKLSFFTTGLVSAMMLLSLGLLVRMSGQVSLCHAALAAVGAVTFSQLHIGAGLPWLVAFLLGGLVAVPVGALVAVPAIRLSGLFLALATFGFGILVQQLLYPQSWMFSLFSQGREMPHPGFAESPEAFYYVVLAALVLTALLVVAIERSRLGRLLRGLGDSPTGIAAMGLSKNVALVTVFCISAFLAGEAGVLLGVSQNFASGGDPFYNSFNSLVLLAMLAVAPFAEPWYALVAIVASAIPAYVTGDQTTDWLNVLFGAAAVGVAMSGGAPQMPQRLRVLLQRLSRRPEASPVLPRGEGSRTATRRVDGAGGIEVRDLRVRFGGLVAVDGVSFRAPLGSITGLIGPNGAGKTSAFDACSGLNRRFSGTVLLHGKDVTRLSVAARARRGLGRTFQSAELCDTLTVLENVQLGDEAARAGANPLSHIAATRTARTATRVAAIDAIEECGIVDLAGLPAGVLSTGQRRLVELARCFAGPFDMLLLDEPSSGLDRDETARLGDVLAAAVERRGVGLQLVEHDMTLVMRLCSHIHVMDFGKLIYQGPPSSVAQSSVVQSAYLGSDDVMAAVAP
jgi:ABC-type branched-subunit amino acid transport system ATPase component/branched-subunit amino acid ABC-type transport system permease component